MRQCCPENYAPRKANVEYKYIHLHQLAQGIKIPVESLGEYPPLWYSDNITLTIRRKGVSKDCEEVVYYAHARDNHTLHFLFDKRFQALCRGRYEGIVSVDCYDIPCRLDFNIGQNLCLANDITVYAHEIEPIETLECYPNPDCCDVCELREPCGCDEGLCQTSIPMDNKVINLNDILLEGM